MGSKQLNVTCPCCATTLTVDVLTGKILRQARPADTDETGKPVLDHGRWDDAADHVKGRAQGGQDEFDSALEKERNRSDDLDDLFAKAKEKAARRKNEEESL